MEYSVHYSNMTSRRSWAEEDMLKAFDAVTNDGVTVSGAAKLYNVPRMTLTDRLKGRVSMDAKMGRPVILGSENEKALMRYIEYMAEHHYPITRSHVLGVIGLACAITIQQGNKELFRETGPSLKWWRGFHDRHANLSLRKPEAIDRE